MHEFSQIIVVSSCICFITSDDEVYSPRLQWDDCSISYQTQRWYMFILHGNVAPLICDWLIKLRWRCNCINLKERRFDQHSRLYALLSSALSTLENERDLDSVKQGTKAHHSESPWSVHWMLANFKLISQLVKNENCFAFQLLSEEFTLLISKTIVLPAKETDWRGFRAKKSQFFIAV